MKQSLLILTLLALMCVGCNTNKAATSENSSTNQPPAGAATAPSSNPDQEFIANAAKGNREEAQGWPPWLACRRLRRSGPQRLRRHGYAEDVCA